MGPNAMSVEGRSRLQHEERQLSFESCDRHAKQTKSSESKSATTTTMLRKTSDYQNNKQQLPSSTIHNKLHLMAKMIIALMIALSFIRASEAVDCFKCSSRNGSNPACEDPFHNLNTTRITSPVLPDPQPNVIYHTPCYAGKKGKEGLFPASACIKLTGTFDATGETLVVRHCALDSGTLTQDTELARMSHCGKFQFEGDLLRGCVLACPEDACNSARARLQPETALVLLFVCLLSSTLATILLTQQRQQLQAAATTTIEEEEMQPPSTRGNHQRHLPLLSLAK